MPAVKTPTRAKRPISCAVPPERRGEGAGALLERHGTTPVFRQASRTRYLSPSGPRTLTAGGTGRAGQARETTYHGNASISRFHRRTGLPPRPPAPYGTGRKILVCQARRPTRAGCTLVAGKTSLASKGRPMSPRDVVRPRRALDRCVVMRGEHRRWTSRKHSISGSKARELSRGKKPGPASMLATLDGHPAR